MLDDVEPLAAHGPEDDRARGRVAGCLDDLSAAVAGARDGDEQAFAVLWRALHPALVRYLSVRGNAGPEDLAAETWMHALQGLPGFEGDGADFRAWLFTIARHRAIDQGRARARRPETISLAEPVETATAPVAASAEDEAAEHSATAAALRLVATLPPAQAEMVVLRVVAGLEVAEVARIVGKRPGTVRVTVHRALQTLAREARIDGSKVV